MFIVDENQTTDVLEWCWPWYYAAAFNTYEEAHEHMLERVRRWVMGDEDWSPIEYEGTVDEYLEKYFEYKGDYACCEDSWMWRILEVPGTVVKE